MSPSIYDVICGPKRLGTSDLSGSRSCTSSLFGQSFKVKLVLTHRRPKRPADVASHGLTEEDLSRFDLEVGVFLSPNGVPAHTQVLAYDGHALVGNVGGFLGLFLGASILSIYDLLVGGGSSAKERMFGQG